MKRLYPTVILLLTLLSATTFAQLTLGPSPYSQDFNSIGTGLPAGFTVRTGSTATALGTAATYSPAPILWNNLTGAVKNFASGSDLPSGATATDQGNSTNRSIGIRQSGSLGDPGAAFVLQLANTTGLNSFKLNFKLQSLDITSPRTTTWRVDYGFGATPTSFTVAAATGTLTTGGSSFTNNAIAVDFGNALDNQSQNVWIRIVTVTPSTGSGNRASSAIDDVSLTYSSGTVVTPSLSVNPTNLAFGNQALGTNSTPQPYTLNYSNLNGSDVTISVNSPFAVSKSGGGPFSTNLTYSAAELTGSSTTVFAQFSPAVVGSAIGTINHTGGGVSGSTTVSLTGTGVSLNPVATNDSYSGTFGSVLSGNVSSNDSDPQSLALTYTKLTNPQDGILTFNSDGTFSYQSAEGSAAVQTFTYRAINTQNFTADATVTITLVEKTKIFISQYYEGTSVNKWIELTNPTNSPINTASPQLRLGLYNISGDAGNIVIAGNPSQVVNLNITIPAKSSVLIGNTGNGNEVPYLTATSAQQTSNAVINFNGNDGVALLDATNNIIDAFGTGINAKDVSYVRNQEATAPAQTFDDHDWTRTSLATVQNAADLDDANRLGVHVQPDLPECVSPTAQASSLSFSAVGTKTITLNFNASADASEYLIVRSLNNTLSDSPANGTLYSVGNALGGGTVAARITGTAFTDNNLPSATEFNYFIFALNNTDCDGGPLYLTSNPLTGTQATDPLPVCFAPPSQPTNFQITFSNYNLIQGKFDASSADEFLIVMSRDSLLSSLPVDQTIYAVGDTIGGGIVIKNSAQTSFNRTGLEQNTKYFFFVFALNSNCSGGPLYLTSAPLTGSARTGILDNTALNYYYGNLHSHSSYSDGNKDDLTKKPEDDYAFAKNSRKMDFLGISEHNHTQAGMRLANWQPGMIAAKNATTSDFVALHGMEWGVISGGGHVIVYGIDSLIGWEPGEHQIFVPKSTYTGPTGLFNIINRHGLNAIATLAHPNTSDYNNIAATYNALADSAIVGSALESGPAFSTNITYSDPPSSLSYLSYYNRMLARGYHLGASLDHDNHNMTFGRHTRGRLVVLAPALTENDLLDAMKRMRFYASQDSAARISFTINNQLIGSSFAGNGTPTISVSGSTSSPIANITIVSGTPGSGILPTALVSSSTGTLSYSDTTLTQLATSYYYVDITEADGSRIITSPIWYTRNDSIKSAQTITFNDLSAKTYGDADFDPAASSTNATIPIVYSSSDSTIASIVAGKVHIRNAGSVIITASQAGNSLFHPAAPKSQTLIVNPKAVTAFADAKTKVYGTADPELTYAVYDSLLNGDTFTGSLTREAGENAGVYNISGGTLALGSNYTLTVDTALFTITPKDLLITADDKTKPYGSPNPVFTASYNGFVNGDSTSALTLQPVFTTTATDTSSVGTYPILVSGATADNYSISFQHGTLAITQASQFITFDSLASKTFGDADFALVATGGASGNDVTFTSSDTAVAIVNGSIVHMKSVGTTLITASQAGNTNYPAADPVTRTLIVNKATAVISLSNLTQLYDGTPKSVTVTTNPANVTGVLVTYNGSTTAPAAPGSYAVVATLTNSNYSAAPAFATMTINGTLKVQYRNADNNLTNNAGKPFLKILNAGAAPVPYSQLTVRYWITPENFTGTLGMWIDYAQLGNNKVTMKYVSLASPRVKALGYIEYGFTPSAGSLAANGNSGEIQSRFANSDWTNFNEGNDHSVGANSTYGDNSLITLYQNGILIWGTEPAAETPLVSLKAFSIAKNVTGNSISTYVDIRNEGNVAVNYNDITARYWFTADGSSPLNFWVDYAKIGNNAVSGNFTPVSPVRVNADRYLELKVNPTANTFYPFTSTGNIQYRITKSDWSNFSQANDHSYQSGSVMTENARITIYYQGQLVYGTEPALSGSARVSGSGQEGIETESSDQMIYPNPSSGKFTLVVNGNQGVKTIHVSIYDMVGKEVDTYSGDVTGNFRRDYDLKLKPGIYTIRINRNDRNDQIRLSIKD